MIALIISSCAILFSQSVRSPTFEVASVKRVKGNPGDPGFMVSVRGGPGSSDPERITYTKVNLLSLLFYAYDVRIDPMANPSWLGTEHYDIQAKIPPGTTLAEFRVMLQNLLVNRFHMTIHHETRDFDGYELLVARGGLKMARSSEKDSDAAENPGASGPLLLNIPNGYPQLLRPGITVVPRRNSGPFAFHLIARGQTLSDLTKTLKLYLGNPIVDKTSLEGRYDCTLDFLRGEPVTGQRRVDVPDDAVPYIPDAVESLGLKMVPAQVLLDTVVVDYAERIPTDN